jgi:hypothetical protein
MGGNQSPVSAVRAVEVEADGLHGREDGVCLGAVFVRHDEAAVGVGGEEDEEEVGCHRKGSGASWDFERGIWR